MRTVIVLAVALLAAVACVSGTENELVTESEADAETEVDSDSELAVPTLPGLGMGCLPTYAKRNYRQRSWRHQPRRRVIAFGGKCVAESTCPEALMEHGYCAGIGTVCCKNGAISTAPATPATPATPAAPVTTPAAPVATPSVPAAPVATPSVPAAPVATPSVPSVAPSVPAVAPGPVLRAGTTVCQSRYSTAVCKDVSQCTGANTAVSGLCPGASHIRCCVPNSALNPTVPAGTPMSKLVPIPSGINPNLAMAGASFNTGKIGSPGCPLTAACFSCNCATSNGVINRNRVTANVTPKVRITGLKPFVDAVKRAFDAMLAASATRPELKIAYDSVKSAGGLCCRPIKRSNGQPGSSYSNHSWGVAVDFYFGSSIDPRGDGKTQYGLSLMAPFFAQQQLYWAAAFRGSEEDAMHFEASQQALTAWKNAGLLK